MSNYILPELWCICGCKEFENWNKTWADGKTGKNCTNIAGGNTSYYYYTFSPDFLSWQWGTGKPREGYIEISFEEFVKYVLNKEVEINYQIY